MYDAIKYLFPGILDSQFALQDDADGRGPYIKSWTYSQPQPTQAQIDAASIQAAIPKRVKMAQARLALLQSGLLSQVDAAISAMTGADGDAARIEWQYSQAVERDRLLVKTIATQLNLSAQQLDDLFTLAATL